MPPLATVEASNSQYAPSYIPTAVFVGGSSGIGLGMAEALVAQTKGKVNIILVGRNKARAEEIIAGFPSPPPEFTETVKHEFIQCDATEMKNVHATCQQLLSRYNKINYLVLSAGPIAFSSKSTSEGNDAALALRYYCRPKFIMELMPSLEKAKEDGEDARVLSIMAAARGRQVVLEDIGLQNWKIAMTGCGAYNDVMTKVLSDQHPKISFTHIYPGMVDTPGSRANWILSIIITILKFFVVVTPQVAAQYMLYPLLNPDEQFASGGHWMDNHAEPLALPANLTEEVREKVWKHTLEVIRTE